MARRGAIVGFLLLVVGLAIGWPASASMPAGPASFGRRAYVYDGTLNIASARSVVEPGSGRTTKGTATRASPFAGAVQRPPASVAAAEGEGAQVLANQAAGNAARDPIASQYAGAEIEVGFQTELGLRRVDVLTPEGLAIESKVGYTSLTQSIQMQIAKDQLLLESGQSERSSVAVQRQRSNRPHRSERAAGGSTREGRHPWFLSPRRSTGTATRSTTQASWVRCTRFLGRTPTGPSTG